MPDVRMPDGTIIRNVPAGTTKAQLEARWRSAQPKPRVQSTGSGLLNQVLGTINETLIGGVQGVENIGRVVTDPIVGAIYGSKALEADRQRSQSRYDEASRNLSTRPQPVARTVGQIAAATLLGRVKAPAALGRAAPAVTRAAQGAVGGAAARDTTSDAARSMGIGAATNLLLPPALGYLASTTPAKWLGGKLLSMGGAVADDAAAAGRKALGLRDSPRLPAPQATLPARVATSDPAQLAQLGGRQAVARAARLRAAGVTRPTTGMVTRNPRVWTAERELAKIPGVGDDLQQALVEANQGIAARSREIVGSQGGGLGSEATGQRVSGALATKNQQLNDEVGALYKAIRVEHGGTRVPSLENLKVAQAHPEWADNTEFDNMVAALNKRLLRYADADGGAAGLTVHQAEELRKFIGNLGPNNAQGYAMRRVLQDGLDADVLDNIGGQPFAAARAAARARFEEFKGTFPGKIADEGIPPERLTKRVLSAPLSDVRDLTASLTTGTPAQVEAGSQALQAVRGQAIDDLFSKGISTDGTNVTINPATLVKHFESQADTLREILDPATYKEVRRLVYGARDAGSAPAFSNVNYSNTASAPGSIDGLFPQVAEPRNISLPAKAVVRGVGALVGGGLGSAGGPLAGMASAGGGYAAAQGLESALISRAQRVYLERLSQQAALARDPYAAAESLSLPSAEESARLLRLGWQQITGDNPVLGGLAASTQKR